MPVSIKVAQLNWRRLEKIRRELGYLSNEDFFRTIPLNDYQAELLDFLREQSPEGGDDNVYKAFLTSMGFRTASKKDEFMSFKGGWRVKRETQGTRILFNVSNLLETVGGARGKIKFRSVEFGSRASTWVARRTFRFLSKDDWITIKEGRVVEHEATPAANVTGKARVYIETVMLPKISAHIDAIIKRRLK